MIFDNKRSELEIVAELLSLALKETKKTRLMYQTNLCNSHFKDYMDFLLGKGFITIQNGNPNRYYVTTERGRELLSGIKSVLSLLKKEPTAFSHVS
ncbi:MAG: winged helix-turn-helix domain-containing protein [Petrotogales bacterium]